MQKKDLKYIFFALILTTFSLIAKQNFDIKYQSKPSAYDKVNDLRILAVMVEFEEDSLGYTTGNGKFDSEYDYPDSMLIDAGIHNREYFEDQLEFVKNYFDSQSGGSVQISYSVFPDTLTLPHPMWYYNPNNGDEILAQRLDSLYSHSWAQVKNDSSIPFSAYNTFVIFHAGSGQEFNPGYDETPFDIPSVFLSPDDLGNALTAYDGTKIDNCIILPECEWQTLEGKWYHAGMGGISCLMFAHRLGIPNLYSSDSGKSCIGKFGLMDQGSANFSGLIPSGVSAWVKELKGWAGVKNIEKPESNIIVNANDSICRIELNSIEYLLIENRTPVNFTSAADTLYGYDRNNRKIAFYYDKDGIERYKIINEGFKTLVSIQDNDYDFGLPLGYDIDDGSDLPRNKGGILVWHIDKRKTTAYNIENNLVNSDYKNRGVYLEEADGSFDIGQDYWLLDSGYGTEYGWFYDAFFSDNWVWRKYSNESITTGVEFSSRSYPRSDTNDGIQTGIKLNNFSQIGREMFFDYGFEDEEAYFSLDSRINNSIYLPAYNSEGSLRHFFTGKDGSCKIFDKDSLIYSGSFTDSITMKYLPVQSPVTVFPPAIDIPRIILTVSSDSTKIFLTDIAIGTFQTIVMPAKIISQPVDRILATENGVYKLHDDLTIEIIGGEFKNADKLSVLTDGGGAPVFIKGENNGILFSIENPEAPYETKTEILPQDSINYSFIQTDITRSQRNIKLFSYAAADSNTRLSWNDTDDDGKLESIISSCGELSVKNENGFYENGFPVNTDLGSITKCFVYNDGDQKYLAVVDSSSNYTVISSEGEYYNTGIRTMNGFGINSGLLKIENSIFLYNYNKNGVLTYHRIGTGTLEDYFDNLKGVAVLGAGNMMPTTSILSKNVYNWPNPARGEETRFRFFNNIPCRVEIDIYDINGNRIKSFDEHIMSWNEYAEIPWDVTGVPSGVYNAILKFSSASDTIVKKVKVAVIK